MGEYYSKKTPHFLSGFDSPDNAPSIREKLLFVRHAPSPNTRALARALARGAAKIEGVELRQSAALRTGADAVLAADAIVLGTTENFGYMAGGMKDFFRSRLLSLPRPHRRAAVRVFCPRRKKTAPARRARSKSIVGGMRWKIVAPPLVLRGDFRAGFAAQCEELGETMAAALEAGIF